MPLLISLILFLFSISAYACLNLNGNLHGTCIYRSESFGELNGSIDFSIQQPNCQQITINGAKLSIPGSVTQKDIDGNTSDIVTLSMNWKNQNKSILIFDYDRKIYVNDRLTDEALLKGSFYKSGPKIILQQSGTVDQDPVDIYCELRSN